MTDPRTVPDNKAAQCVRCGLRIAVSSRRPVFDANGVAWYGCPRGCQPPEAFPAACVPLHEASKAESVFDPTLLDPDDTLYEGPTDAETAEWEMEADAADSTDESPEPPAYRRSRENLRPRLQSEPRDTTQRRD